MCCHPNDLYTPIEGEVETGGLTVIEEIPEEAPPEIFVVEPTQEQLDEIEERDEEIALEGEPE